MTRLFISHSSHDESFVCALLTALLEDGRLAGRVDLHLSHGSHPLWVEIEDALDRSSAFAVVVSSEALESDWVHRELRHAVRIQQRRGTRAFPIVVLSLNSTRVDTLERYFDEKPIVVAVTGNSAGVAIAKRAILDALPPAPIATVVIEPQSDSAEPVALAPDASQEAARLDALEHTTEPVVPAVADSQDVFVVAGAASGAPDEPVASDAPSNAADTLVPPIDFLQRLSDVAAGAPPRHEFPPPRKSSAIGNIDARLPQHYAQRPTSPHRAPLTPRAKQRSARARTRKPALRIFVCYRRDDSGPITGRIYDRLTRDYGEANIFKDVDNIPFGVDFVDYLDSEVQKCDVVFVVIGQRWLSAGPDGRSRIENPNDFVRIEIASALRRAIPVVPVLVDGAQMPYADQLPEDVRLLARRNAAYVRHDPDFHADMTRLLSRLG